MNSIGICIFSKKGNSSVLLALIFSAMLMLTVVFVYAGANFTNYSYEESVLQTSGRAILSEFHAALKDDYGIFAFKDFYNNTEDKLKFYILENFRSKKEAKSFALVKPKLESCTVILDEFALIEPDNFKKEALESLKYPSIVKKENKGKSEDSEGVIRNKRLISKLPSNTYGKEAVTSIFSNVTELVPTGKISIENFCMDMYIEKNFNTYDKNSSKIYTFFQNEIEYIIYGKLSDAANLEAFKRDFWIMRLALNSAHIYANPKKMQEITELAEILTPGVAAVATAVIIAEAWAIAETSNDVKLILDKKNVAFAKTDMQWAVGLGAIKDKIYGIVAKKSDDSRGYIVPTDTSGMSYDEYLRLVLAAQKEEKKIYRSMDLIQINLQGCDDEDFFIEDCYTGLAYNVLVNGKRHQNVQNY